MAFAPSWIGYRDCPLRTFDAGQCTSALGGPDAESANDLPATLLTSVLESGVPVVVADRLADVVNGSVADGEIGGQLGPCPPTPHAGP